jgi:AraC-like DNA-binding protein/quercetin dioxygenase-like cupin family protein
VQPRYTVAMPEAHESHGRERWRRQTGGIRFAQVAMSAGLHLPAHAHSRAQLVFVLAGSYAETWRQGDVRLHAGSVLFRPPAQEHENDFDRDPVQALVISYPPERLAPFPFLPRPAELPALSPVFKHQILLELPRGDGAADHALEGLALLLLSRVERAQQAPPPGWLAPALAFIDRHLAEPISLATIAAALGVRRPALAGGFRRHLGRSVGEAIRDARLGRALDQLRGSRRPLCDIAAECGFYDQAHMGLLLKREIGLTPGEVRAAYFSERPESL